MIPISSVFPIGQVIKPHGVHGEMSFSFTSDVFDRVHVPYFIVEMDGILVPFFLKQYRLRSNTTGLLTLDGIDTDEQAREFAGLTVYLPKTYLDKVEDTEIELDYFAGFTLVDAEKGVLGVISEVDQTTENVLFVVRTEQSERLIPASEEYIEKIDHQNKLMYVTLPEGLLDI